MDKYGKERCCNILVFGRMQTKAVIKDIGKVLGVPYDEVNAFTKVIPSGPGVDIHIKDIVENLEYKWFTDKYPEIFKHAALLEGSPRHISQHPAGIAVTPMPVTDIVPVYNAKPIELDDGTQVVGYLCQTEKDNAEHLGLNITGSSKKMWKLLEVPKAA